MQPLSPVFTDRYRRELNFWGATQSPIHWIPVNKMALLLLKCRVDRTVLLPILVTKYAKLIVLSQKDSTTFKRYLCAQSKKHSMLKIRLQAGLVSRQEHVPEKHCTNQTQAYKTQNSHLKHCISWGLGD
jgi:hypothetical protein